MKFNRRDTIRQLALGAGAAFSGSLFHNSAFASVSASFRFRFRSQAGNFLSSKPGL
jgi:hypothetical protein